MLSSQFNEVPEHAGYFVVIDATREAARNALANLPSDSYLTFYDASEPRGTSDPGTYFSMRRKGVGWQITGGNHGWSHGVVEISDDEAAKFLYYCLPSNRGPSPDQCIQVLKDDFEPHWKGLWSGSGLKRRIRKVIGQIEKNA